MTTKMNQGSATIRFGWTQKLGLAIGVPLTALIMLELLARLINAPALLSSSALDLEMPTWMMRDENARIRATRITVRPNELDWLSLFQEGLGYRVHLTPGIERRVSNTFSQIPEERDRKYLVRANSLGFRSSEISPRKNPDVFRILLFGDSSSFGWGVDQEDTFASLLNGRKVVRAGKEYRIEVGNFAIPGDSSAYGELLFDVFAPQFEADLVVLGFGANDAKPVYVPHTQQVATFRQNRGKASLSHFLRMSAVARTVDALLGRLRESPTRATNPRLPAVPRSEFGANLTRMGKKALGLGVPQILALSLCTPDDYAQTARQIASDNHFLYYNGQRDLLDRIDELRTGRLYPELVQPLEATSRVSLEKNPLFYVTSDSCHPNQVGHRLIADALFKLIEQNLPSGKESI